MWAASALSNFWPSAKLVVASFLIIGIFVFRSRTFSILLIAALVGITIVSFRQSALHNQLITSKINSTVLISGLVRSDPQLKPGQVVGSYRKPDQFSALLKVKEIDGIRTDLPIRIRFSTKDKIQIDQYILVKVRLVKSKEQKVAALGIATGDISIITQPRKLFRYTGLIRQEFRNLAADSEAGRLIPGLVLGDTSLQSPVFIEQMRKVGLSHLTAVSGANFALVAAFLFWFLQFVFKSIKQRLWIIVIILFLFIFLVRPTPSVLRAAVMSAVILLSKYFGERSFGITSLAAAITLLILLDPIQSSDPGFALSVLATAGILILSPSLSSKLVGVVKNKLLAESIAIPLSATIFCLPVIVLISSQLAIVSVPANILVAPVIAPITILGFIAAVFAPFIPLISSPLLFIATIFAQWIVWISKVMSEVPQITFNKSFLFILLFILLAISIKLSVKWPLYLLITGVVLLTVNSSLIWPGVNWQVANCDVGQGDGLVVNLGSANAIVIDVGPDPIAMDQCLRKLGIKSIPLLVLTHFHADHVGGLSKVLSKRQIGEVWISNLLEPEASYKEVVTQLGGVKVKNVEQGQKYALPSYGVEILVVWPRTSMNQMPTLPGDGSVVNNSSISVIIKSKALTLFAGGDIEPAAQEEITKSGYLTKVDLLKVSHHGSAYQYLPMLDKLQPTVAIISVGKLNSYGHPDPEFISELLARGIKVWRTDQSGGISLVTPNKIRATGKEWWQIQWG